MVIKPIVDLFQSLSVGKFIDAESIPQAGSSRLYYRIAADTGTFIATVSDNVKENRSFIYFAKVFENAGLPVPRVLGCNSSGTIYIQTDAGSQSMLDVVLAEKNRSVVLEYYKKTLQHLLDFQIKGGVCADFSHCVREDRFSDRLILADLNYFKYYFLKLTGLPVEEHLLDDDFHRLASAVEHTGEKLFMYRDFQARNIMVRDGALQFIDFQGGMNGPLQYDVASLLYQARAGLSAQERSQLLDFYVAELAKRKEFCRDEFYDRFNTIVFIRILQTLGAYGFRGFIERKQHFIDSIKPALENLAELLPRVSEIVEYAELLRVVQMITQPNTIELICKKLN